MKKNMLFLDVLLIFAVISFILAMTHSKNAAAQSSATGSTDPHRLLIPRWFLTGLTLDGQVFEVPQARLSLQFKEDARANGEGGCNSFFSQYGADADGTMHFEAIGATRMFCEQAMELENAYFEALAKVTSFEVKEYRLILFSADGQTSLVFSMPPK